MKIISTKGIGTNALKILVFGESGSGKTTLAGTIPGKTLIISSESGLLPLRNKEIDVIDLAVDDNGQVIKKEKRVDRLLDIYKFLLTDEAKVNYQTIFIDSLTEINQNFVEKLQVEFPERRDSLVLYSELSKNMRSVVKMFRDLPNYNVIFTALAETEKDENSVRYTAPSLIGKFATQLPAYFDEVFYLSIAKDEKTGESKRVLITEKTDRLMAKDRSSALDKFEKPDLSIIFNKIRGTKEGEATNGIS